MINDHQTYWSNRKGTKISHSKKCKLSAFELLLVIKNNLTINIFETAIGYQLSDSFQSVLVHLGLETDTYQYHSISNIFLIWWIEMNLRKISFKNIFQSLILFTEGVFYSVFQTEVGYFDMISYLKELSLPYAWN